MASNGAEAARHSPTHDSIRWGRDRWAAKYGTEHAAAMETVSSLVRVREVLIDFMESHLEASELTFGEYDLLNVIEMIGGGSLALGKIRRHARRFFNHQTSVTNIIKRLAAKGYVETSSDPEDGRVTMVAVTSLGRRRLNAGHRALAKVGFGLEGLPVKEQEQLNELLFEVRTLHGDVGPMEDGL